MKQCIYAKQYRKIYLNKMKFRIAALVCRHNVQAKRRGRPCRRPLYTRKSFYLEIVTVNSSETLPSMSTALTV